MRRSAALAQAMFAATRALEEPVKLPEAPATYQGVYNSTLADCRKMAAEYGLGDDAFLDNRIRTRLHKILLATSPTEAQRLGRDVWEAVQIHLILVAHRAGKLQKVDNKEPTPPIED